MALHRYDHIEQRSEEWHALRRGIITASTIAPLITTRRLTAIDHDCPECGVRATEQCLNRKRDGVIKSLHTARTAAAKAGTSQLIIEPASNDKSRSFTAKLFADRITPWIDDVGFITDDMLRGIEHEPLARDRYAQVAGAAVTEVGFMVLEQDGYRIGYSPDGLVDADGLLEVKCPRAKTHIQTIISDTVPIEHMPQLQTGLLVSGREWIDFVSYFSGLPLYIKRVRRDDRWTKAITAAARAFEANVTEMHRLYSESASRLPATERVNFDAEMVI